MEKFKVIIETVSGKFSSKAKINPAVNPKAIPFLKKEYSSYRGGFISNKT